MRKWQVLARHKWVAGCTITESINLEEDEVRRFTATIRGWRNWVIYEGVGRGIKTNEIVNKVKYIREQIDNGNKEIFDENVTLTAS